MLCAASRLLTPVASLLIAGGSALSPSTATVGVADARSTGPTVRTHVSGCLTDRGLPAPAAAAQECERIDVTAGIETVVMRHEGATFNCCSEVSVDAEIDGSNIRFLEREVGEPCHCECPFNLAASVEDLPAGRYTVEVRGPDDELKWVQFVEVFPAPPRVSFGYSPCPLSPTSEEPLPARVEIGSCAGKVTVKHLAARVNCCLDLSVEMTEDPGRIVLKEVDSGEPCFCTCTTDIMIGVDGLAPGRYLVDLIDVDGSLAGSATVEVTGPRKPARRAGPPR